MIGLIARLFRGINGKLLRFSNPLLHRPLKLSYALSAWLFRLGLGRSEPKQVITAFDGDGKILIDPARTMGAAVFWTGFHEFRELLFLHRYLKADMVFIDAGANIGLFSVFAARRLHLGKVISFEPVPALAEWLEENIAINHLTNVVVHKCGLSDADKELPIYGMDDTNEGLSTLYPVSADQSAMIVPVRRLDGLFSGYGLDRLDFIKMDIEGGELPALRGARESLLRYRPTVMVEINETTYTSAGYKPVEVYAFFRELGYNPFEIGKDGELLPEKLESSFSNIVFVPS